MNFNGFSDCLGQNVKSAMKQILDRKIATGCGIMIGRGGKLCYEAYAGYSDKERQIPTTKDTVYRMYSTTKLVTVVAALQLWEKSAFSMLDPLYMFIPEFKDMMIQDESGLRKAQNPILIKHLFTMTAGLSYDDEYGNYRALAEKWLNAKANGNNWDTLKAAKEIAKLPLAFEPGEHFRYSFCLDILGALIEIWSGERFDVYCKEHIFKPLGMNNTSFDLNDLERKNLAQVYTPSENGLKITSGINNPAIDASLDFENVTFFSGGAGLLSTLEDYFKFACMLASGGTYNGVRILGSRTIEYMHTPQLNEVQLKDYRNGDHCCFGYSYSYGLGVRVLIENHTSQYVPVGEWGWSGALGTWVHIDPKEDLFYVYVHQRTPADHDLYIPFLDAAIYSSLE